MGVALAEEARDRGASVTFLAGLMDVAAPPGVEVERIESALQLEAASKRLFPACDVLIMAAAVGDFRPAQTETGKIRRREGGMRITLETNPDILAELAKKRREDQVLVGFALEIDPKPEAGWEKLARKNVDLLVMNDPLEPGAAIGGETNVVTLLEPGKQPRRLPVLPKRDVARKVLDWVAKRRASGPKTHERSAGRTRRA
jgi:phosphopantothenoylcysteine decarboxylase/phosphopantothenate--cysteine ligase